MSYMVFEDNDTGKLSIINMENNKEYKDLFDACAELNQLKHKNIILEEEIIAIEKAKDYFYDKVFQVIDKFIENYSNDISSYGSCYGAYLEDKLELMKKELKE